MKEAESKNLLAQLFFKGTAPSKVVEYTSDSDNEDNVKGGESAEKHENGM